MSAPHFDTDRQTVVLCGAGHVSAALCIVLQPLGWQVIVIDDRRELLTRKRFPHAHHLIFDSFTNLSSYDFPPESYFVTMTHSHELDFSCLAAILSRDFGYAGMLGSKTKAAKAFSALRDRGFGDEPLSRIHTPIGLPIGAETPGEIAVCIAAEMIRVYRSTSHNHVDPSVKAALQQQGEKILATVVATAGITSRQKGASMVVFADGKTAGTVGGGNIEYEAIRKSLAMLSASVLCAEETFSNHTGGEMTIRFERK
ncbi:MAG: XdhC family protein [Oscillospiraceae bacterium]|nr:XdhC family protein [Oscillospiraceae bacterium]